MARPDITPTSSRRLLIALSLLALMLPSAVSAQGTPSTALSLRTPLGDDLVLTGFSGTEELSRLFRFELEMVSDNHAIGAADILGRNVTFGVARSGGSPRFFNGHVSRFVAGDEDDSGRRQYRAEVVPWLWFLTKTTDCRIFQDRTVPEIVKQVTSELGFSDLRLDLTARYRRSECTVQYRESDFDFVSRLMERVGISYYFAHEEDRHTLVLTDSFEGAGMSSGCEVLPYQPATGGISPLPPFASHIMSWEHGYRFTSGRFTQTDFNFMAPNADLLTTTPTVIELPGNDRLELFDSPGKYDRIPTGEFLTRIRMEEEETSHDVVVGATNCRGVSPGNLFSISSHPGGAAENGAYVITSIRHTASEPPVYESGDGPDPEVYSSRFTCVPSGVLIRPPRITRIPVIPGVQTAIVVGRKGEMIHTDRYGRVKVRFHWDREGKSDESSSCWIRVAHDYPRTGPTPAIIPRVGSEVVVSFLEGDPDRPIIVGRVHNASAGVFVGDDARPAPKSDVAPPRIIQRTR